MDIHPDELGLPEWATGVSSTPIIGSQLCTRDGRRMGNAVIVGSEDDNDWGRPMFTCVTDVGTIMKLTALEIEECFHPLHFVMDPARHPGVERLAAKECPPAPKVVFACTTGSADFLKPEAKDRRFWPVSGA